MNRISWDEYGILIAYQASKRSTCSRLQVGAILMAPEHHIIGTGYNGAPKGIEHCKHTDNTRCRISVHAEANALLQTSHTRGDTTLYVTHAPCFDCSKLIINKDVKRVVYAHEYRSNEGLQLLYKAGIETSALPL
jgi:dCMP deaminase